MTRTCTGVDGQARPGQDGQAHSLLLTSPISFLHLSFRVGRTGRAGDKDGQAHSLLLTPGDSHFAVDLEESLALGGQGIPPSLHDLAMKDAGFRKGGNGNRVKGGRGGGR